MSFEFRLLWNSGDHTLVLGPLGASSALFLELEQPHLASFTLVFVLTVHCTSYTSSLVQLWETPYFGPTWMAPVLTVLWAWENEDE